MSFILALFHVFASYNSLANARLFELIVRIDRQLSSIVTVTGRKEYFCVCL